MPFPLIILGAIAAAGSVASGIASIVGANQAADAEREANELAQDVAEKNAAIADYNAAQARAEARREAQLLDLNAGYTEKLGRIAAGRIRSEASRLVGTQKVRQAASGIDIAYGTAADVRAGTVEMSELDAAMVQNNAAREAWGMKVQAESIRDSASKLKSEADSIRLQSQLDNARSRNAQKATLISGYTNAGVQILGAGSNLIGAFK